MTDKLTLSVPEVSRLTGLSRTFIYEMIRSGELPSVHIGTRRLILRVDLDSFLNKNRTCAVTGDAA